MATHNEGPAGAAGAQAPGTRAATAEAAAQLVEVSVSTADRVLREIGFCSPPTVWMLLDNLPSTPIAGYIKCREFYRGRDAAEAIARLGTLPASMMADRIVVSWEHADLCSALELPGADTAACGQVVLDATVDEHWVHWHPLTPRPGPPSSYGTPTVIPQWGPSSIEHNAALPAPISELLRVYRWDVLEHDYARTNEALQRAGYLVNYTEQRRAQ